MSYAVITIIKSTTFMYFDIIFTVLVEMPDQLIIAKHNISHLVEELATILVSYVVHLFYQACYSYTFTRWQTLAFRKLKYD